MSTYTNFFNSPISQQQLGMMKAFRNKKLKSGNRWEGKMTDGVRVRFHINNGIIDSAYPFFK